MAAAKVGAAQAAPKAASTAPAIKQAASSKSHNIKL